MRTLLITCATTALLAMAPAMARAAECPADSDESRMSMIAAAPGCKQASQINDSCSLGSGGDTEPTQAVIDRCEKDFLGRLPPQRLRAYRKDVAACNRKYARQSGTMYVSFTMYCLAHVAVKYSGQ